ncbi:addiction module protein [bacterium]|nr:addiction module protein [bacterium]MBU1599035.1 addiction module protein [bacterium]MBU2461480.1 addiction module protein [bacterium]
MDKALLEKALGMPPNERVAFAELVLSSIDYEEDAIRQSWIIEVKDRMKAVDEGRAKLLDFEGLYNED